MKDFIVYCKCGKKSMSAFLAGSEKVCFMLSQAGAEEDMKFQKGYRLVRLGGEPYLLPYGQAAANLQRGVRLNESGVFLWNALLEGAGEEELLARMIARYEPLEEEIPALRKDLQDFLKELSVCRVLLPGRDLAAPFERNIVKKLSIGGITTEYRGPGEFFPQELQPFCGKGNLSGGQSEGSGGEVFGKRDVEGALKVDLALNVVRNRPSFPAVGEILVRNFDLTIIENEQEYICLYTRKDGLAEWHLTKDFREATMYCALPFHSGMEQEILHGFRMIYLALAQERGLFALHSASVLYDGRAWLFSGPSGAGKSTHTNLWRGLFGTPVLNGDLNLIGIGGDGQWTVYGIPWCGTSGISTKVSVPLGGVAFLGKGSKEEARRLSVSEGELSLAQRLVSPAWTEGMFLRNLAFAKTLTAAVPLFGLRCTKEPSAAITMREAIDGAGESSMKRFSKPENDRIT